ncbi:MAG: SDR family NAD(P)-dependent oxidoreductase, partial [Saprospiraceae bacterium]|nr:SDR family NAD(P)-dependent oxidoreductase [Saprospiraceae bacterium]
MSEPTRVIIVTGGASGIGLAISAGLLADGHAVTVMDASADAVANARESLPGAHVVHGDVTRPDDCAGVVAETMARFGGVGVLINNAGIGVSALRDDAELRLP